ncbi:MAG TPA: alpha/beta fold hydrolase [Rubrobacteraceae bacterium]|nr:alpha/beta fold hydrolase [Rubrobacteraceae bacterium]
MLVLVGSLGVGCYASEQLLKPDPSQESGYEVEVLGSGEENVELSATTNAQRIGTYGLEWAEGYGQVESILNSDESEITREFHPILGIPEPGDALLDSWAFPHNPERAFGMEYEEIQVTSELGELPAWYVEGTKDTWMIFVHGHGTDRGEGLRILPTIVEQGFPSLVMTYRNDAEAPKSPDGLYHLGQTEWRDLEAAADYALAHGAEDLILVGYSMGGAITCTFLRESVRADRVRGAILDAPALDWDAVLTLQARERGLPHVEVPITKFISSFRTGIDWSELDQVKHAEEFSVPMLLFHGDQDKTVPVESSDAFAEARPDLVTYHRVHGADHVESWNLDPEGYRENVEEFLLTLP